MLSIWLGTLELGVDAVPGQTWALPAAVRVEPSQAEASSSALVPPGGPITAGQNFSALLLLRDAFGNPAMQLPDGFSAVAVLEDAAAVPLEVAADLTAGSLLLTGVLLEAGEYELQVGPFLTSLLFNGEALFGCICMQDGCRCESACRDGFLGGLTGCVKLAGV